MHATSQTSYCLLLALLLALVPEAQRAGGSTAPRPAGSQLELRTRRACDFYASRVGPPDGTFYRVYPDIDYVTGRQFAPGHGACPADETCMDVYVPIGQGPRQGRTIVYLHEGGFRFGSKNSPTDVAFLLGMVELGYHVVTANYTLACAPPNPATSCQTGAPENNPDVYPLPVTDAMALMAWVRGEPADPRILCSGPEFGLPQTVLLMGASAGGMVASTIGTGWNDPLGRFQPFQVSSPTVFRPDLVVAVSAQSDLFELAVNGFCAPSSCAGPSPPAPACFQQRPDPCFHPPGYPCLSPWPALWQDLPVGVFPSEWLLDCNWGNPSSTCWQGSWPTQQQLPWAGVHPNAFIDSSPRIRADAQDSDYLLIHATCDTIAPFAQAQLMRDSLLATGGPWVRLVEKAGCGHGLPDLLAGPTAPAEVHSYISSWPGPSDF